MKHDINYNFIDRDIDNNIKISKLHSDRSFTSECIQFAINYVKDNQVLFIRLRKESKFFDIHFRIQPDSITCKKP